nr:MAG TPA: hypothetical protein [Caudoviricetes sp.]
MCYFCLRLLVLGFSLNAWSCTSRRLFLIHFTY